MTTAKAEAKSFRFPLFEGLLPIKASQVPTEVIAGITLAALAIPEVMGYTKISGTPVITGLYTILIPMILYAIFGASRHLVVGADSATAAILAAGLVGLASVGSDEYVALAGVLAILVAVFLFIARIVGLGFLADFLSSTVLVGFLTGIGIQVAFGQIGGMLGLEAGGHGTIGKVIADLQHIGETNFYALAVAIAVLVLIVGLKKISHKIPGALLAVIGALVVSWAMDLEAHGVHVLGTIPSGLPTIGLPHVDWSWDLIQKLLPIAFAMFVVILAQSAATSRAYAARYNERFSEDTDLVGLGLANIGAAMSGTFVVNGSPTKTQMVDGAGGRSQLTHLTTALIVVIVLLFLTKPLSFMPEAVLAAIVFLIGVDLIDVAGMKKIFLEARSEFWVALITAAVVVVVGVEQGILLAMVLSLLDHVRRGYRPANSVVVARQVDGFATSPVGSPAQFEPGLMAYRFSSSMYYANAELFSEQVLDLVNGADPRLNWFCIVASAIADVDYSAAAKLRAVHGVLKEKGVRLVFALVSDDVRTQLDRYGITDLIGKDAFFGSGDALLNAYHQREQQ
ncbi:MAG TPA: SulP family inorganic anion transporter [Accumulibacter sp.]|uniref:SulP family inorganic anion transporter n=1 Tax=Accumulibacter sp. TaxID=2053492 RepID=UPI002C5769AE|nr:SulP family inorganic anion transporter [Accumulibacter sp.]HRD88191.1 SulP family inorganic anion transporter [Accumulibacter sp.]